MPPTIQTCPHCGAPLAVTRFGALVVCSFCDATVRVDPASVPASKFREAWAEWNRADNPAAISVADTHWIPQRLLAHGEVSDVYLARRARWPSELAVVKTLRDAADAPLLERECRALRQLHGSEAATADMALRVPYPIAMSGGSCAYRWAAGFLHTAENVREIHREGVPPVASIWVWRRILEILTVMRRARLVHGAILPHHLLIQDGEHGVRLVGFSCAGAPSEELRLVCAPFEEFYPRSFLDAQRLTYAADIAMSARCIAYLLGGRADGELPDSVPEPLADLVRRFANDDNNGADADPWQLRRQVGDVGRTLFGAPAFHPIAMN